VDFFVHARDLVETRLHGLARGDFAFREFAGEFGNGELVQHRIFGPLETNIERRTSNAEHRTVRHPGRFGVRCSMFEVRCFLNCMFSQEEFT
jgi:hypothetical protein